MSQIYLKLILSNWAFWVSFLGILGYLLFETFHAKLETKKVFKYVGYRLREVPITFTRFSWKEGSIVFVIFLLVVPLTVFLCFQVNADTQDHCHNGTYITSAYYQEGYTREWDTIESRTVDDGNGKSHTETYTQHHIEHVPPVWVARTSEGKEFGIDGSEYRNYTHYFGSNVFTHKTHPDQTSSGDGNEYLATWNPKYPMMPASYTYSYENYIKASKRTVLRQRGLDTKPFQDLLASYPTIYSNGYGNIALDRVTVRGVKIPSEWIKQVNYALAVFTAKNGATLQINPQVYIAGTDNVGFANVLRQEWIGGKKNDAILIIGMKQWPNIDWVDTMHWSKNSEFGIRWQDFVREHDFSDPNTVLNGLSYASLKYQRRSFKEYRYLLTDVEIPLWANVLVLIINLGLCLGVVKFIKKIKP